MSVLLEARGLPPLGQTMPVVHTFIHYREAACSRREHSCPPVVSSSTVAAGPHRAKQQDGWQVKGRTSRATHDKDGAAARLMRAACDGVRKDTATVEVVAPRDEEHWVHDWDKDWSDWGHVEPPPGFSYWSKKQPPQKGRKPWPTTTNWSQQSQYWGGWKGQQWQQWR
mmetsp:Transcript_50237/g.92816  ORF Transcript_50237/g.92816 Transcript_50237/m.92816 type:complete len:168 (+) Transcript_50237:97-600(+)